ncbi:MAG TPA: phage baseplate assembly protein V [Bryobacteraceae bacterium]|nr:phage baseplate assembly protein V [Bryobacteraceae bacterium]
MSAYAPAADLVEILQGIVREELRRVRFAEVGVVTDVFPHADASDTNNYQCTVKLRDSGLELPRVPVATGRIGFAAIPNVGDMVLVHFLGGNLHGAVVSGRLYNDQDIPPQADVAECVYVSPDPAKSGVRRLYLEFPNGNKLTLDDDKLKIEMGQTILTVNNGGDVEVDSNAKVTVSSQGDIEFTSQGNISLNATGSLSVKAQSDLTLEGLSATVKAQTSAQVQGGASTTVKGPMLTLAGTTSFSAS